MNRKFFALIFLTGCDPHASDEEQSAYDEGFAEGYQAAADALNADYAELEERLAKIEANEIVQDSRIDIHDTDIAGLVPRIDKLESRFIETDITLAVLTDYEDIAAALDALAGSVISSNATVTIQIEDGSYVLTDTLRVNHGDGDRIQILGNTSNPSAVTLSFLGVTGIEVSDGAALGYLDGVTVVGDSTEGTHGVYVHNNSFLSCGPSVQVRGFGSFGFYAELAGVLLADYNVATDNGGSGFSAASGSIIRAGYARSDDNAEDGFVASLDSLVSAPYSSANGNQDDGFDIHQGATGYLYKIEASENVNDGLAVTYGSYVRASGASLESNGTGLAVHMSFAAVDTSYLNYNTDDGAHAVLGSFVDLSSASFTGNGDWGIEANYGSSVASGSTSYSSSGSGSRSLSVSDWESDGSYMY